MLNGFVSGLGWGGASVQGNSVAVVPPMTQSLTEGLLAGHRERNSSRHTTLPQGPYTGAKPF